MTTEPKHTPEPWQAIGSRADRAIISDGRSIARVWGAIQPDDRPPHDQADANAARIVACVNACAGIPTEELEAGCVERLARTTEKLLKTAQHFERQSGRGVSSRRGGPMWTETRAALAPFQDKPE